MKGGEKTMEMIMPTAGRRTALDAGIRSDSKTGSVMHSFHGIIHQLMQDLGTRSDEGLSSSWMDPATRKTTSAANASNTLSREDVALQEKDFQSTDAPKSQDADAGRDNPQEAGLYEAETHTTTNAGMRDDAASGVNERTQPDEESPDVALGAAETARTQGMTKAQVAESILSMAGSLESVSIDSVELEGLSRQQLLEIHGLLSKALGAGMDALGEMTAKWVGADSKLALETSQTMNGQAGASVGASDALVSTAEGQDLTRMQVLDRPTRTAADLQTRQSEMLDRVVRMTKLSVDKGGGEVRLRLHPPKLGFLRIQISVRDGVVQASMQTENAAARHLISQHLQDLRDALAQQGLDLAEFDVSVGKETDGSDFSDEQGNRDSRFSTDSAFAENGGLDEALVEDWIPVARSWVDYVI